MSRNIQEKNNKISKDLIIEEILKVFPTLKDCADALEMTDSNFSHALSPRQNKFMFELKALGIDIPSSNKNYSVELNDNRVKENQQQYLNCIAEINELKKELSETKKLLSISVNRITELEKENEKLRAESAALLNTIAELGGGQIGNKL